MPLSGGPKGGEDVGIEGMHRLFDRFDLLMSASVLIVVAVMEGALPSVIGGLVKGPVIAVPTSIGYGASLVVSQRCLQCLTPVPLMWQ